MIDAFIETVKVPLQRAKKLCPLAFGTFNVIQKKARKGRNSQSEKEIQILV